MRKVNFIALFVVALAASANASLVNYVGVKIAALEKHAENVNNCAEGSQNYLILGLRNAAGAVSYVWVATANPQYKDIESIALTALSAGLSVTIQADNDGSYQICSISGGKLRFITLSN